MEGLNTRACWPFLYFFLQMIVRFLCFFTSLFIFIISCSYLFVALLNGWLQ